VIEAWEGWAVRTQEFLVLYSVQKTKTKSFGFAIGILELKTVPSLKSCIQIIRIVRVHRFCKIRAKAQNVSDL
jgi:hypothetical protein